MRVKRNLQALIYHIEHSEEEVKNTATSTSKDFIPLEHFYKLRLPNTGGHHFLIEMTYTKNNDGDPDFKNGTGNICFLTSNEAETLKDELRQKEHNERQKAPCN